MYKWSCFNGVVSIEINAAYDDPGDVVLTVSQEYDLSADDRQILFWQIENKLQSAYGMFGHLLNPQRCCPCDMDYALMSLPEPDKRFLNPVLVEGERKTVALDLPDGAVS